MVQRRNHLASTTHLVQRQVWSRLATQPHLALCAVGREAAR
jgi:hypothetical protein